MFEKDISVGLDVRNNLVRDELGEIISLVKGFHIQSSSNFRGCDIMVLEIGEDLEREFQLIHKLKESGSVSDVFLTSSRTEPEVLIRAMRTGACEFFPQPLRKDEIIGAFSKFRDRSRPEAPKAKGKRGKVINFIGSKGGIGTTTIAVNFAASLLELKGAAQSVALIDMNLLFGEVPLFLDMEPAFNWGEVAKNISRLDSVYLMSILSKHPSGMFVLPSPTGIDGVNMANPEVIEKILHLMQKEFDYIVIDGGHSLDEISLKVMEMSDMVMINSILSLPCLINVRRLVETLRRLGCPSEENIKIVINRYHKNSVISVKEAEKGLQKRISWYIPNDFQTTISAINQGKLLSVVAAKAEITRNVLEFAAKITNTTETKKEKSGLFGLKFSEVRI